MKRLYNSIIGRLQNSGKPSYFNSTHYRFPTKEEIKEINDSRPSVSELLQGITYNIVGKGLKSEKSNRDIVEILEILKMEFPGNPVYEMAIGELNSRQK